jgi:uncharacterized RDD family membrane protein YckC
VLPNFFCTMCGNVIPADQLVHISGRAVCAACKPRYVQQMQEGLNAPVKVPMLDGTMAGFAIAPQSDLADPATRLVAYILDVIFIGVPVMIGYFAVIVVMFGAISGINTAGGNASTALSIMTVMFVFMGAAFGWVFFYWTWFIGRRGATPGMKIMKLKMVRADRSPVGYGLAFGRAFLLYIINAFTMGLTNITAFFDREKRTLTDMICGTRVLRVAP